MFEEAASCVSNISQLKKFLENLNNQIKDQWVMSNTSKFQLNLTVDEVTMTIFLKELKAEKEEKSRCSVLWSAQVPH